MGFGRFWMEWYGLSFAYTSCAHRRRKAFGSRHRFTGEEFYRSTFGLTLLPVALHFHSYPLNPCPRTFFSTALRFLCVIAFPANGNLLSVPFSRFNFNILRHLSFSLPPTSLRLATFYMGMGYCIRTLTLSRCKCTYCTYLCDISISMS